MIYISWHIPHIFVNLFIRTTKEGGTMKELYQEELKKLIASYFVMTRKTENISQNKMSEWLLISERSYVEIEHGHNLCNPISLLIYLVYYCQDPLTFLEDVRKVLERVNNSVA